MILLGREGNMNTNQITHKHWLYHVTEAKNVKNEYYGEEALLDVLTQVRIQKQSSSRDLVENVFCSVCQFSKGMEQNDDITILWVEYKGNDDNDIERRICDEN